MFTFSPGTLIAPAPNPKHLLTHPSTVIASASASLVRIARASVAPHSKGRRQTSEVKPELVERRKIVL